MISFAILLTRSNAPASLVTSVYASNRVNIPKAPALGLLLEEPLFDTYNKKISSESTAKKVPTSEATQRDPINFAAHNEKIEEFKQKFIYDKMRQTEQEEAM